MTYKEAIKEVKFNMSRIGLKEEAAKRVIEARNIAIKSIEENQQYSHIGTVEEFRSLKEKSIPKKPIYSDYDDDGNDKIIPYKAICPVCENEFEFGYWNNEDNHHCICGQVMDWEQE